MPPPNPDFIRQLNSGYLPAIEDGLECVQTRLTDEAQRQLMVEQLEAIFRGCISAFGHLYGWWINKKGEEDEKVLAVLKLCSRTMNVIVRSPVFGPKLDVDTLAQFLQVISPLTEVPEHQMEILESRSLLYNHLDRSVLLQTLLRAARALVKNPGIGYAFTVKQLGKVIKLLELQLRMYFDHQVKLLKNSMSEFSGLEVESILKDVNDVLVECEKSQEQDEPLVHLTEELESLLNLLIVYSEVADLSIHDQFRLITGHLDSPAYRYVLDQLEKISDFENKENADANAPVFLEKPAEFEDFVQIEKIPSEQLEPANLGKDWILVDGAEAEPQDLAEFEL